MSDDLGDVGDFDTPPTTVERFLLQNPRYGEQIAETLKATCEATGKKVGQLIKKRIYNLGHELSDQYVDMIMKAADQALIANLPAYVDKSDIEILDEDDCSMEAEANVVNYFVGAMMPYVISATADLADGLDWGLPFSIVELIRERYPNLPVSPEERL